MYFNKIKTLASYFKLIFQLVDREKKIKYTILQFHILLSSILETLSIFSILPILDSFNNSSKNKITNFLESFIELKYLTTEYLIVFFCLFLILSNSYLIFIKRKITLFSYELLLELQKKIFQNAINKKYKYFINKEISYFNNLILHETQRFKSGFIESFLFLLSQLFLVTFTLIGLMIYNFKVTIFVILILLSFYTFYILIIGKKLLISSKLNSEYKKKTIQFVNDIFSVIKTLIFKNNKFKFYEKLENILKINYNVNAFEQVIKGIIKNLFEIYFLTFLVIIFLLKNNSLKVDNLIIYGVYIFAAYKIIPSFHLIYSHVISFFSTSNSLRIIINELKNNDNYSQQILDKKIINKIKLKDVSFSYDKKNNVLKDINFEINENKIIGICGKSGSGKTTFIDVISGLIEPTEGELLVNGEKNELNNEKMISNSTYCSQKTILIDDSLRNNISLETSETILNEKLLKKAIEVAELSKFINNLDNGVDTIIGEDGVRVSGGEAQRISIARTIFADRKFIFFDESLNSLDMITAKKILNNLEKLKDKTIFFITHDLRLLSNFNDILIFEDAKIIERGSFKYLKENSKKFLELMQDIS